MELRYLRYFVAAAEDLNFSQAARRLHVDQSALSRRIHDLEDELHVSLFTRSRRRVELTPAGEALLQQARRLLVQVEETVKGVQRAARGETGRLDIAYITALSDGLIPRLLRQFLIRFPEVTATLRHMRPAVQIQALLEKQLDVGFVGQPNPEYEKQLVFEVFRRDPMEVVVPVGHRLAQRKQVRLADLAKEKFIMLTRVGSPYHYDWLMRHFHQAGFHPDVVAEAEFRQTATDLVAAGYGIALFPATSQSHLRDDVAFVSVQGMPVYEHAVAWRRENASPPLQAFLNLLRTEVGTSPPQHRAQRAAPRKHPHR